MIKGIMVKGKYMGISGGTDSGTYMNHHTGLQGIGNVRYNTVSQVFEVYDGTSWVQIGMAHAQIGLTTEAESILDWARHKRAEEERIFKLAEQHPGIKDLQEKLNIMITLVSEGTQNDSQ